MASAPTPPGRSGLVYSLYASHPPPPVCPTSLPSSTLQTIFAAFGGILFGYDTGVISGVQTMKNWLCVFGKTDPLTGACAITSSQQSLVVSTLSAGTFCGALFAAPAADFLGRRWSVVLAVLIFSAGVAMQAAASALPLFVVGRIFAGWGVGMVSTLVPMYQSECSPKWIRYVSLHFSLPSSPPITHPVDQNSGAVISGYQWVITIGLLIAAVVNNATKDNPTRASWQIPVTLQFIWGLILAVGMTFLPESPRWLIMKERDEDAARALSRLISLPPDHPELQAELNEVRVAYRREKELGESSYLDCFRSTENKILLRTLTGIFIQAWQQLTGINFIIYYGTVFFEKSGISNPFLIAIAINIINVFTTIPGMWGVERFGRRRLLLVGALGMCVCEFLVAIVGVTVSTSNIAGQKVLIAFVCIYIAFFASTWGPVAWVVSSEIFPLNIRAKAMSLSIASNWFWNFILGFTTPYLVNKEPGSVGLEVKVFFIWGGTCAGCFLFTYFCVPEVSLAFIHPR